MYKVCCLENINEIMFTDVNVKKKKTRRQKKVIKIYRNGKNETSVFLDVTFL